MPLLAGSGEGGCACSSGKTLNTSAAHFPSPFPTTPSHATRATTRDKRFPFVPPAHPLYSDPTRMRRVSRRSAYLRISIRSHGVGRGAPAMSAVLRAWKSNSSTSGTCVLKY